MGNVFSVNVSLCGYQRRANRANMKVVEISFEKVFVGRIILDTVYLLNGDGFPVVLQ